MHDNLNFKLIENTVTIKNQQVSNTQIDKCMITDGSFLNTRYFAGVTTKVYRHMSYS